VYLNRGLAGWVDVAQRVGVNDLYDGRAVALADLSNRGAQDVIVANQNQPAMLYRDYPDSANHWIAFTLVGTRSNRSAIGAEVVVESGGTTQRRIVDGGMGLREPERPPAALRARQARMGRSRHRRLAVPARVRCSRGPTIDRIVTVVEPAR
jgi:hypothetical protein